MVTALLEKQGPADPIEAVAIPVFERVESLVGAAIRLAVDPTMQPRDRVREIEGLSSHDSALLGRAWLRVQLGRARSDSRVVSEAEAILRAALNDEAAHAS